MSLEDFKPTAILDGKYRILETVGSGGMGTVVKAKRLSDDAIVAVKFCHCTDENSTLRFRREARLMKAIEHPRVIPVLDDGGEHDPPYFVMPFAESSIDKQLDVLSKSEDQALAAFEQLCDGVQAIHNANAIHRDIKPGNALIIDGDVVVSDLGLAKLRERDTTVLTQTEHVLGTPRYLAPEQKMRGGSRDADERTDVYQLGKTLYEMVTGLDSTLVDASALPPGLAHVVRRATRDQPEDRYQSVGELLDGVKTYQMANAPDADPLAAYEAILSRIRDRVSHSEYRSCDIKEALQILACDTVQKVDEQFIELVDDLPSEIIPTAATIAAEDFGPVLAAYVSAIDRVVITYPFAYAESVARRMRLVFDAAEKPELRVLALEAVLMASVRLNRFAAMGTFDQMLLKITSDDDAYPVRDMLERRDGEYAKARARIPSLRLHTVIRSLPTSPRVQPPRQVESPD